MVDKTEEDHEVSLTAIDFLSAPDTAEVDLRKLGIDVPDDPTMGNKAEGDIATPNFKNVMRDESGMLARNSIRQPYRSDELGAVFWNERFLICLNNVVRKGFI